LKHSRVDTRANCQRWGRVLRETGCQPCASVSALGVGKADSRNPRCVQLDGTRRIVHCRSVRRNSEQIAFDPQLTGRCRVLSDMLSDRPQLRLKEAEGTHRFVAELGREGIRIIEN